MARSKVTKSLVMNVQFRIKPSYRFEVDMERKFTMECSKNLMKVRSPRSLRTENRFIPHLFSQEPPL
jgi:hypothetical protein